MNVDTRTAVASAQYVRRLRPGDKAEAASRAMMQIARDGEITEADARRVVALVESLVPEESADEAAALFIDALSRADTEVPPPPAGSQYRHVVFPERPAPSVDFLVDASGAVKDAATERALGNDSNPWRWLAKNVARRDGHYKIGIVGDCAGLAEVRINTLSGAMSTPGDSPLSVSFVGVGAGARIPGLVFGSQYGLTQDVGAWNLEIVRPNENAPACVKGKNLDGELVLWDVKLVGGPGGYGDGKWWDHDANIKTRIMHNVTQEGGMSAFEWIAYGHYNGDSYMRKCDLSRAGRGGAQWVGRNSERPNHHTVYETGLVYVEDCFAEGQQANGQGGAIISCYSADTLIVKDCRFNMTGKTKGCAALWEPRDYPKGSGDYHVRLAIFDGNTVHGDGDARSPYAAIAERVEVHNMQAGDVKSNNRAWDMVLGSDFAFARGAPEMRAEQLQFYNSDTFGFRVGIFDYGAEGMRNATDAEFAAWQ